MPRRFLIDGYNLMHAVGMPAQLKRGQLERSRQRLLSLIHERHPHDAVTVVFDSQQTPRGAPREQSILGIRVIFAPGIADDLIHEMLTHETLPRKLIVVSSDHAVQQSARRREAQVLSSQAFLDDLGRPSAPPTEARPEKPTNEIDPSHWLDAFASIDDEPDVRRMQHIDPMNPDPDRVKKHRLRPKKKEDQ